METWNINLLDRVVAVMNRTHRFENERTNVIANQSNRTIRKTEISHGTHVHAVELGKTVKVEFQFLFCAVIVEDNQGLSPLRVIWWLASPADNSPTRVR